MAIHSAYNENSALNPQAPISITEPLDRVVDIILAIV